MMPRHKNDAGYWPWMNGDPAGRVSRAVTRIRIQREFLDRDDEPKEVGFSCFDDAVSEWDSAEREIDELRKLLMDARDEIRTLDEHLRQRHHCDFAGRKNEPEPVI